MHGDLRGLVAGRCMWAQIDPAPDAEGAGRVWSVDSEMTLTPKSVSTGTDGVPSLPEPVGEGTDCPPLGDHPIDSGERLRGLLDQSLCLLDRVKRDLNAQLGFLIAVGGRHFVGQPWASNRATNMALS